MLKVCVGIYLLPSNSTETHLIHTLCIKVFLKHPFEQQVGQRFDRRGKTISSKYDRYKFAATLYSLLLTMASIFLLLLRKFFGGDLAGVLEPLSLPLLLMMTSCCKQKNARLFYTLTLSRAEFLKAIPSSLLSIL